MSSWRNYMSLTMKKIQPSQIEKEINHLESQIGVEKFQLELEETKLDSVRSSNFPFN